MAESLYAAERAAAPDTRTAVIAWADYTAPAGLGMDAAIGKLAEDGAVRLSALVRALPGKSPVELFCHSYGSVVCGVSPRQLPPRVSDIAVAGSPGMRVGNAAQLDTTARVWAMRDKDDWIQDVPYLDVARPRPRRRPGLAGLRRPGPVGGRSASATPAISSRAPRASPTSPPSELARISRSAARTARAAAAAGFPTGRRLDGHGGGRTRVDAA